MTIKPLPSDMNEIVAEIVNAVSRSFTAYTVTVSGCNICNLDPVTNLSDDGFCLGCNGNYWIKTYSPHTISGYIFWGPSEESNWQSGGRILEGECRLTVLSGYLPLIDLAEYFEVDGKTMYLKSKKYRGIPEINRAVLIVEERD